MGPIRMTLAKNQTTPDYTRRLNHLRINDRSFDHRSFNRLRCLILAIAASAGLVSGLITVGCSSEPADKEPTVSVQMAAVEKTTIQHAVHAQAILFPLQQAAIVPKISAPVQKFLVKRGSAVHQGELLAVLENRDLVRRPRYQGLLQAGASGVRNHDGRRTAGRNRKAEADAQQSQAALDAQAKVFESRQQLFDQGALPRKELDQSRVDVIAARNQQAIAKKHLDALMAIGKQQELKSAEGQSHRPRENTWERRRSSATPKFAARSTAS